MINIDLKKKLTGAAGQMVLAVKLDILPEEFITVYGRSGAGKTSLLRMIAGLMRPDWGRIEVDGEVWYDSEKNINLRPQDRRIGFVFQDYALFPHMSVRQNLEYALTKGQDPGIVNKLIEVVGLGELQNRSVEKLSGGQKQRVALARALVRKPRILMLDEPLSALDPGMRTLLQDHILQLHREYKLSTLMISHEIGEVVRMSDRVIFLDHGKLTRMGPPQEMFTHKMVSGKFQFAGEIIRIEKVEVVQIVTILVGNTFVKVIADTQDADQLQPGDRVMVASKAFNPVIRKIEE